MLAMGTFGLLQLYVGINWIRGHLGAELFRTFFRLSFGVGLASFFTALTIGQLTGYISPWTGRFWTLLDPTYAKEHIPIIASVSEHQVSRLNARQETLCHLTLIAAYFLVFVLL